MTTVYEERRAKEERLAAQTCEHCGRPVLRSLVLYTHKTRCVRSIAVKHDYYGCDTGCCGHVVYGYDCRGREVYSRFEFDHPEPGEGVADYARALASGSGMRGEHLEVDLDECELRDYDSCPN